MDRLIPKAILAIIIGINCICRVDAADFACPAPSAQTARDIETDINGKAETLAKIVGAEVKGAAKTTVVDLFSKYPNADRIAIINTMVSTTCNFIKNSRELSDNQKIDRWMSVYPAILSLMPDGKKSELSPKQEVPSNLLQRVTLGKTNISYLTSVLGAPNHTNDNVSTYTLGGYEIQAQFCCRDKQTTEYKKGAILQLLIEIDSPREDGLRDELIFFGPWINYDANDPPPGIVKFPKLGESKLSQFTRGCSEASMEGGLMTNSETTWVCSGGGYPSGGWIKFEYHMSDDRGKISSADSQRIEDFETLENLRYEIIKRSESDIKTILRRQHISGNLQDIIDYKSPNYSEKILNALQPLTVVGFKIRLDVGAEREFKIGGADLK